MPNTPNSRRYLLPVIGLVALTLVALPAGLVLFSASVAAGSATAPPAPSVSQAAPSVGCTSFGFGPHTNLVAALFPWSVAVADFNRDGNPDLAVANQISANVSVLLGDGTGGFGPATNFATPGFSSSVAVGDFNNDGIPDLVTANDVYANVSVLLGDGTGGFGPATNFATGPSSLSVSVGDFDRDGNPDLAVASYDSDNVSILLGNGTGDFGSATNFGAGDTPASVAVGDFDRDANPDLVTANFLSRNVSVLLNTCSPPDTTPTITPNITPTNTRTPTSIVTNTPPLPTRTATDTPLPPTVTNTPLPPTFTITPTNTPASPTNTPSPCARAWSVVPSPNQRASDNQLLGVAVAGPNDVWAVGRYYTSTNGYRTLVERWNGSAWTIVPSPNPGTIHSELYGVAVAGPNDVWAVGDYINGSNLYQTLVERWDGSAWSIVPSPSPGVGYNYLYGLAVAGPSDVWAVGFYYNVGSVYQTLVEHWDGSSWSIVPSPNQGPYSNELQGVAVAGPNDVWAVGYAYYGDHVDQTLVEHWDGSAWSIVPSPSEAPRYNELYGVAVAAANDVWAVGYVFDGGVYQTLVEHWDGSAWSIVPSPNLGIYWNHLWGVAVAGPNDVWAVGYGYYDASAKSEQTLVEHWNGSAWSIMPSPNQGLYNNELWGVAVAGPNDVWAVGLYEPLRNPDQTLVESYTDLAFTDVHANDYFYTPVRYLYCHGAISGYGDNTFRPYNLTTRAQLAKIVVLAEGWSLSTPTTPTFRDVPAGDPFYLFIETAYSHAIISGYSCGPSCLEYRPGNNVTRAQLCKIIVLAEGWPTYTPPTPTFHDVPATDPFYSQIETAYHHSIISGYTCGPSCLEFRPGNNATRGQICKIVYLAVTSP